jgi:hypothetical protein
MKRLILAILLSTALATAAGIDGRWTSEIAAPVNKKSAKAPAGPNIVTIVLKSNGGQLTGTVSQGVGKRSRTMDIQNAKVQGDSFSFDTIQKGKKGEVKWSWRGTVKGDELTGTRMRDGARRGQSFTAKRSS